MGLFVLISWVLCISTAVLLIFAIWKDRSLLLKPSIIVIIFYNLMIQWAAAVDSVHIWTFLPEPWVFVLLAQAFPFIGLTVSLFMWRRTARRVWSQFIHSKSPSILSQRKAIALLAGYVIIFIPYYLHVVPVQSTGLYTIFNDPENSAVAREYSLKLVENQLITYGYAFMASAVCMFLAIYITRELLRYIRVKNVIGVVMALVGLLGVILAVSLSGARGFPASIVLGMFFAEWFRRKAPLKLSFIGAAALIVLLLPTILSILRTGGAINWGNYWSQLKGGIFWRIFYIPMETGLWHVHYAQTYGYFGMQGIPRLASFFGFVPINVPNLIAIIYSTSSFSSVIANTSYVFAYYSYFGPISICFSLLGLILLDVILLIYRHLSERTLLACIASISVASIAFLSTEYTTVLLSNGFITILLLAKTLDVVCKDRIAPARII